MSAFVVSNEHINALVSYASDKKVRLYGFGPFTEVRGAEQKMAELLLAENVKSVNHRYEQTEGPGVIRYVHRAKTLKPVEVIKACDCLDYQSCEHPEWEASVACALLKAIREEAISLLPGYSDAAWSIAGGEGVAA